MLETALLPCSVGGIIGVMDAGQSSVRLLETASPAEVLLQALAVYPDAFAAQGRFPSSYDGLLAFMAATGIGVSGVDTAWNDSNYNCQGFADALARSLLEAGVAEDARLIHFKARENVKYWFDPIVVNHAVTEIVTADGTRYLIDAQTHQISPPYTLNDDGEIPHEVQNDWLLGLSEDYYGGGSAEHIDLGGPRDVGDTWDSDMTVTNQSQGLNNDRTQRNGMDWETTWTPNP